MGTVGTLGCGEKHWHRSGFGNPLWNKTTLQGETNRLDVVKHPGGILQLGEVWRTAYQNYFSSIYSAGERESKADDKIWG